MAAGTNWSRRATKLSGAVQRKLPDQPFAPQLARLVQQPSSGSEWLHELKWDGYRLVGTVVGGTARLWSRNALEWTHKVPKVAAALEDLGVRSLAVDGELIAGKGTQADFNVLQATLSAGKGRLVLVLFDLLHVDGVDIADAPLTERKALLKQLLANSRPSLALSTHVAGDGDAAFRLAAERKFEGIISKQADEPYHYGQRDWLKVKVLDSDEFAVVGFTPSKGSRIGFGSLLLAKPNGHGGWVYAGRVGTGFSDELIRELRTKIGDRGQPEPTVEVTVAKAKDLKGALWFKPLFVVEVYLRGIGTSGLLRQPSLKAVRPDKRVKDLRNADR